MPTAAEIASALADPQRLRTFARIVLADEAADAPGVSASALRQQIRRLVQAGLVEVAEDGRSRARPEAFQEALAGMRRQPDGGADPVLASLLRGGRLTVMPAKPALRRRLLERVAEQLFEPAVTYSEKEVNQNLGTVHDDFSMLRRYLVDAGLLTRSADGDEYRRAESVG